MDRIFRLSKLKIPNILKQRLVKPILCLGRFNTNHLNTSKHRTFLSNVIFMIQMNQELRLKVLK